MILKFGSAIAALVLGMTQGAFALDGDVQVGTARCEGSGNCKVRCDGQVWTVAGHSDVHYVRNTKLLISFIVLEKAWPGEAGGRNSDQQEVRISLEGTCGLEDIK